MQARSDMRTSKDDGTVALLAPPSAQPAAGEAHWGANPISSADATIAGFARSAMNALSLQQCRSRVDLLAPRQRDVLVGLLAGYRNKQIAFMLGLSPRTVEVYRAGMMVRLEARSLAQALHIAFVAGLAPSDRTSPDAS